MAFLQVIHVDGGIERLNPGKEQWGFVKELRVSRKKSIKSSAGSLSWTMQTLDARQIELFLTEGYKCGSWDYKEIRSYQIRTHSDVATGAILDIVHLKDRATAGWRKFTL
ncbi:hypothetical protein C5167_021120 [Papaver somniferum]|uniref:Uncharacterized protein n=1 Tax=Papaver somniferum TaxID=3469 RepID=A0A4Y7IY97_PAPSO|nr:hypothetical protein C5167_021120 [Papaver somniferum]